MQYAIWYDMIWYDYPMMDGMIWNVKKVVQTMWNDTIQHEIKRSRQYNFSTIWHFMLWYDTIDTI